MDINWLGLGQILIIAVILWLFYRTFIKNTSSEKMVHGLLGLGLLWIASFIITWLGLDVLGGFLHWVALFLSVGLVVIFQPELRKFFAMMGNVRGIFNTISVRNSKVSVSAVDNSITQIVYAVEYMSRNKTGALIVFQDKFDDGVIERQGSKIDAIITSELLLTIFFDKTPLHDGAMLIRDNRIYSAGAILPLAQNNMNWKYGTRHRAALGLSEMSRAVVLVVSEETGDISVAEHGKFTKYDDMKKLKSKLEKVMKK